MILFLDVVPNFIETVEIQAVLESKKVLVKINSVKSDTEAGMIYKMAIFYNFSICPALKIRMGLTP